MVTSAVQKTYHYDPISFTGFRSGPTFLLVCNSTVSCNGKTNYNNRCSGGSSALDGFFSNLLRSLIPFMQAMNRSDFPTLT